MSQVTQDSRIQRARAHRRHRDEALPSFYGLLQLSVRDLKQLRSAAGCVRCRATVDAALLTRASLIVASAVAFISLMGALFGAQSAIPAVALYVCILCVRFVGFNYAPVENLRAMAVVFAVLTMMPLRWLWWWASTTRAWETAARTDLLMRCSRARYTMRP